MAIDKILISDSYTKAAKRYEEFAFLQKEVASRLMERLELMNVTPSHVLDAGCGTGLCTRLLAKRFNKSKIIGVDISAGMIEQANKNKGFFDKTQYQLADMQQLPFSANQFDLVFSNLALYWIKDLHKVFAEFNRVLKPGGLLIFSTLATDTLMELKQSWSQVDDRVHVNDFYDMHIIGDQVYKAQFENTVMDRDIITLSYKTLVGLIKDIKLSGANVLASREQKGLMGRSKFEKLNAAYQQFNWNDGQLPATCEIAYGHGWKKKDAPQGDYHTYQVKMAE